MFKSVSAQVDFVELEQNLLKKWDKEKLVEKYLHRNDKSEKKFSFLDGPITANNPMGVHHAWGRTYKDLWQRFWNMRGYKQRFQNGFDCQGLWVEVEVEKELNIRNKKDIENLVPGNKKESIAKFVELCKERVFKYSIMQAEQSKRLAYFMDWDNSYYTMSDENNYMIWHFLKVCSDNGWIYKGKDNVPWCPRCETAISQHEMLTEDYKELTHETIFFKLPILDKGFENTFLLVWTTTPWTVPANVVVGINTKYKYGIWENAKTKEKIIFINKDENNAIPQRMQKNKEIGVSDYIFNGIDEEFTLAKEISGKELVGLSYRAAFDDLPIVEKAKVENPQTFHRVIDASKVVVANEGTGLLHVAPGAGKEDFDLGKKEKLSVISPILDDASYIEGMEELSGKNAKKHPELIINFLKNEENGLFIFKTLNYTHRYPACWRCKTELVWKVTEEWYIAMDRPSQKASDGKQTLRERMIEVAKKIKWYPSFGLERELDWLSNMNDWLISKKNRYWGLALPIYECQSCGSFEVIGSKEELEKRAVFGWEEFKKHTPHKPYIDEVKIKCQKCNQEVLRIDDVGNVWLDAGIVPFSTYVDPVTKKLSYTSDKKYWQGWFPADFITESFPGQFKNWFYSMIAMSSVLENTNPYKTVLGFASMLGEDGRPMHKSWGNAIEFNEGADKIGVDVMRWMFAIQNPEQNLLFGYTKANETRRKFHLMLWNVYNFFITYANVDGWDFNKQKAISNKQKSKNVLDEWILLRLNKTIDIVTGSMEKFDSQQAAVAIGDFVNDLSLWYVRRSRDRVGLSADSESDKNDCYRTYYFVLVNLSKLLEPFTPFLAEEMYINLTADVSVHLADWPEQNSSLDSAKDKKVKSQNSKLIEEMEFVRKICEMGNAKRKESGIKVRQPLGKLTIKNSKLKIAEELLALIKKELNIKEINFVDGKGEFAVELDTNITVDLYKEGEAREIVRKIQEERKNLRTSVSEKVSVVLSAWPEEFEEYIKKKALIENLVKGDTFSVSKNE